MTTVYAGYAETPYSVEAYSAGIGDDSTPVQARIQITKQQSIGLQSEITINSESVFGVESFVTIEGAENFHGHQAQIEVTDIAYYGSQGRITRENNLNASALQSKLQRNDNLSVAAFQSIIANVIPNFSGFEAHIMNDGGSRQSAFESAVTTMNHFTVPQYALTPYSQNPYASAFLDAKVPFQAEIIGVGQEFIGLQARQTITKNVWSAFQARATISQNRFFPFQSRITQTRISAQAFESLLTVTRTVSAAFQSDITITKTVNQAFQALIIGVRFSAFESRIVIYNTNNLRILADFPSRGISGENWTASSTQAGDFSANNLNSDITELVWRSADGVKTGLTLICDTEVPQGVFVDTVALLNCNFSGSASVFLDGSNDLGFATVATVSIPLENKKNAYYIAPVLPFQSYRYWRFRIDDIGNANNFVSIGTIVFGSAVIFAGECFTDVVKFGRRQFVDQVFTEGFTNVKNDRGQKNNLSLDFRQINFLKANYRNLVEIFENKSTLLKCLWIPTPQYASRYAVFGKLTELPNESHNDRGAGHDYIDLSVTVDEAE